MKNTDKVVEYILSNAKNLPASKIDALGNVVKALGGELEESPNTVKEVIDPNLIDQDAPLDLSQVQGIEIDGNKQDVKIYSN